MNPSRPSPENLLRSEERIGSIASYLKVQLMEQLPKQKRFELFKNYLRSLEDVLRDHKLLRTSAYLEAFCAVFEDVCRLSRERSNNFKLESLKVILQPIGAVDLAEISSKGRARLTKATIVPILRELIFGQMHVDPDMV